MLCYGKKQKKKQPTNKNATCNLSGTVVITKINAAITSAYLHPREVFFVLHNRSRLNSLMCQHLLRFLLQSKQRADVARKKNT